MQDKYTPILKELYSYAARTELSKIIGLSAEETADIKMLVKESDTCKGVYSVFVTSLVEKIANPRQDIRKHQANMSGGYSGRTIDTVTLPLTLYSS